MEKVEAQRNFVNKLWNISRFILGELKIQNEKLKIVEAGAHDGRLAADILSWLKNRRPELCSEIQYAIFCLTN